MDRNLKTALTRLAEQEIEGALSERLQAAIDPATDAVLTAYAAVLPGNAQTKRSKAARMLILAGARAMLAEDQGPRTTVRRAMS